MATISSWSESILLSLAFLVVVGLVVTAMNFDYSKDYKLGILDSTNTTSKFIQYQSTSQSQIKGGEVSFDATNGISVKSSYGLAVDLIDIVWTFLTGGFIENIASNLNLGQAGIVLAKGLRIVYVLSLVSAVLYALFKVVF